MKKQKQHSLEGFQVAILCTDGVEQSELSEPVHALTDAGANVTLVSPKEATVQAWIHQSPGDSYEVDLNLQEADPEDFDALVLPGGALNGDQLRTEREAIEFVQHFSQEKKPIAAICHGTWLLAEARIVHNRKLTSAASLKTDLVNAGADWKDGSVVIDEKNGGLVTSRCIDDLYDFNLAVLKHFARAARKRVGRKEEERPSSLRSRPGTFTPGGLL